MTLATRCPSCGTVFRVVQDQLRVSEGWVRCGRCAEVFNAAERLVEVPQSPPAASRGHAERTEPVDSLLDSFLDARADAREGDREDSRDAAALDAAHAPGVRRDDDDRESWPDPDSVPPPDADDDARDASGAASTARRDDAGSGVVYIKATDREPPFDSGTAESGAPGGKVADDAPAFVRKAERARRWQRPAVRAALASVALVGMAGLTAQVLLEYRDIAAARWAWLRPALEQACQVTGCRIQAPRLIEGLVVDSSGLVRTDGTSLYKLSIVLRNRAAMDLHPPAIDLSLTNASGSVIARKVLTVGELGNPAAAVPGGGTLALASVIQVADGPVTGYTIELFHP